MTMNRNDDKCGMTMAPEWQHHSRQPKRNRIAADSKTRTFPGSDSFIANRKVSEIIPATTIVTHFAGTARLLENA
jgi:hypothetical protein